MNVHDYATRIQWDHARAAKLLCASCGHPLTAHRPLRSTWEILDGRPVEIGPDGYLGPFHCGHCEHEGCQCVRTD